MPESLLAGIALSNSAIHFVVLFLIIPFEAWNDFVGPLPEELGESIPFLDKVFLEHNGEDFASNVNGVLCNIPNMEYDDEAVFTDQDDFHSYSDLVASCNIPDCLCCTSCEG